MIKVMVFITHIDDVRIEILFGLKVFGLAKIFSGGHSLSYIRGLSFVPVSDVDTRGPRIA